MRFLQSGHIKRHFKFGRFFADIYLEIRLYWNARFYSDPGCAGYYSNPTGWSQLPGWCDLFWAVARISL